MTWRKLNGKATINVVSICAIITVSLALFGFLGSKPSENARKINGNREKIEQVKDECMECLSAVKESLAVVTTSMRHNTKQIDKIETTQNTTNELLRELIDKQDED